MFEFSGFYLEDAGLLSLKIYKKKKKKKRERDSLLSESLVRKPACPLQHVPPKLSYES